MNNKPILQFIGPYRFLSNFYPAEFVWDNIIWQHSEGAFQAAKSSNRKVRLAMSEVKSPAETKQLGKRVDLRSNWPEIRESVMYEIVFAKFSQNQKLKDQLLATGNAHIEEGNTWKDRFWGVCPPGSGNGENKLGNILMAVREKLEAHNT
jgi:hypothetical protein